MGKEVWEEALWVLSWGLSLAGSQEKAGEGRLVPSQRDRHLQRRE